MKVLPAILFAIVAMISPMPALPRDSQWSKVEKTAGELAQLQTRIRSVQRSVGSIEFNKHSVIDQLAVLEIDYGKLAQAIRDLDAQSQLAMRELEDLKQQKLQILGSVLKQNRALAELARSAHAQGRREWLKVLLNREDGGGSNRVLTYYRYLNNARMIQLRALDHDLSEARNLETAKQSLMQHLASSQDTLEAERQHMDELRAQRKQRLAALELESREKSAELIRLREDEQKLQALLISLQEDSIIPPTPAVPPSGGASSERPGWPVAGALRRRFGAPRSSGTWDGVVIAAAEGEPVHAIHAGRVAFADWLRGYGLLAIIDHGDGLMSLYGFNQSINKSVGDWVNAGDVVANVGNSGGQTEPALYFGLRDKGRPVDPLAWPRKTN